MFLSFSCPKDHNQYENLTDVPPQTTGSLSQKLFKPVLWLLFVGQAYTLMR